MAAPRFIGLCDDNALRLATPTFLGDDAPNVDLQGCQTQRDYVAGVAATCQFWEQWRKLPQHLQALLATHFDDYEDFAVNVLCHQDKPTLKRLSPEWLRRHPPIVVIGLRDSGSALTVDATYYFADPTDWLIRFKKMFRPAMNRLAKSIILCRLQSGITTT